MSKSDSSTRSESLENPGEYDTETNMPDAIPETGAEQAMVPSSPPPSYERVLEETRLQSQKQHSTSIDSQKGPEILHKSSKELYKAVAKQFGITCKMSDNCRCIDCQSNYFDCENEQNEDDKANGSLSAGGTPLFMLMNEPPPCNIL